MEARNSSARVEIGDDTYMNNNFVIIADKKLIKIGDRCLIGPDFFELMSNLVYGHQAAFLSD